MKSAKNAKAANQTSNEFILTITNRKHLFWIEVLDIVDVFGMFCPLSPYT